MLWANEEGLSAVAKLHGHLLKNGVDNDIHTTSMVCKLHCMIEHMKYNYGNVYMNVVRLKLYYILQRT